MDIIIKIYIKAKAILSFVCRAILQKYSNIIYIRNIWVFIEIYI